MEFRPGANAQMGTQFVSQAPADGYTWLFSSDGALSIAPAIAPLLGQPLPYDAAADFIPVSLLAQVPFVLVAHPKTGIKSFQDLIARAKANPGSISYGTLGIGSSHHVAMEVLSKRLGIDLIHVPYTGSTPAVAAVVGGQINVLLISLGPALPFIRNGQLNPLAMTSKERLPLVPEIPTLLEVGGDLEVSGWFALVVRRETPAPIVALLRDKLSAYVASKTFVDEVLLRNGYAEPSVSPGEVEQFLDNNRNRWAGWVNDVESRLKQSS